MKRRVVHIITQLELGGAQRNTLYTVTHLRVDQYDPILICGPGGILDSETHDAPWPTYFIKHLIRPVNPVYDLWALVSLYKLIRQLRPHIVHTHSSKAGILGRIAAYFAGVPVILHTFHGFGFTPGQSKMMRSLFVWAEKACALVSTHLIFVSKNNEEEAAALEIGPGKPHSLIRSGIAIAETPLQSPVRDELGIPPLAWVVVSVGNFKPQKNPMDLVKTAKAVLSKDPTIHFILVGDGELRPSVERAAEEGGFAKQIHFLGWRQDIPAVLAASNTFLLTSLWEGLPRALVEAAVARLPSVAYAVNGVKDILVDGETGFPIEPHNTEAAAEKILWLKDNALEAKQFGMNARIQVEKEFDIDRMVRDQENLYERLYAEVPLKSYYEPLWAEPSKP